MRSAGPRRSRPLCFAFIILLVSLVAADVQILAFFSISLPALQIAGGLLIARTAFQMLNPHEGASPDLTQSKRTPSSARTSPSCRWPCRCSPVNPFSMAADDQLSHHRRLKFWGEWVIYSVAFKPPCA